MAERGALPAGTADGAQNGPGGSWGGGVVMPGFLADSRGDRSWGGEGAGGTLGELLPAWGDVNLGEWRGRGAQASGELSGPGSWERSGRSHCVISPAFSPPPSGPTCYPRCWPHPGLASCPSPPHFSELHKSAQVSPSRQHPGSPSLSPVSPPRPWRLPAPPPFLSRTQC